MHDVFYLSIRKSIHPSVRSLIRYQSCKHDICKKNEQILLPVGSSGPQGKDMKESTPWEVRSSKVIQGQS